MRLLLKTFFIALLLIIPTILISNFGSIEEKYWQIIQNQLVNTLIVLGSVGTASLILGVSLSWIFTMYDFPLKRILEKILILSMVFPSYVLAFFYSEVFKIDGKFALILTLTISSIPYVFMLVTAALRAQSQHLIYSAMMFGKNENWIKLKILFPLIIPSIILSSLIVIGDTFSEFGATYFFGVNTIMTGVYEIWFGLHESIQGIRFTAWIFITISIIYFFINHLKNFVLSKHKYNDCNKISERLEPKKIYTFSILPIMYCIIITLFSFFIPMVVLIKWVFETFFLAEWFEIFIVTFNSVSLATFISTAVLVITTFLLYLFKRNMIFLLTLCNTLYSVPGLVLAITATFITGKYEWITFGMFIFILIIKFLAIGIDGINSGLEKISRQYYYSAKTLGKNTFWYILNIQIPLSLQCYLASFVLIWIDVMRELTISLTLRPPQMNLLSIEIFRYMDLEMLNMSGPWILSMVVVTIIPIYWLNKFIKLNSGI